MGLKEITTKHHFSKYSLHSNLFCPSFSPLKTPSIPLHNHPKPRAMTELILSHIVDNIIDELGSAAVKEIGSHCGVSIELRLLESNFSLIKDVLPDAEKRKVHESGIRSWLESLEEAVYEADDLVDDFNAEARRRKEMPGNYEMAKQVRTP